MTTIGCKVCGSTKIWVSHEAIVYHDSHFKVVDRWDEGAYLGHVCKDCGNEWTEE